MSGQVIVITGASGGLGRAHALACADLGATLYVVDVQDCGETEEVVRSQGGTAVATSLDVTSVDQWQHLLSTIETNGGRVRGLVNNAGVSFPHGFEGTGPEDWRKVIDVNLTGAYYGIRTMAPAMAGSGGGSIVNIASIAGVIGYFSPSYGASKWGLIGLTKSAAGAFGDQGVRVNSVLPGLVASAMSGGADWLMDATLSAVPAGRAASPEDVAQMVRFLLSDDSGYANGAEFTIDGGLTAASPYRQILLASGELDFRR